MKIFDKIIIFGLLVCPALSVSAQSKPIDLANIFNSSRIEETSYKLLMYRQSKNALSGVTVIERAISRENYKSRPCIKVTETNLTADPKTEIVIFIDAKTLKPLYFESRSADALVQKAVFENDRAVITDITNSNEKLTETDYPSNSYFSNSFSELVQANDFGKNRAISFATFSPGKPANRFTVERVGEKRFTLPNGTQFDCWILKFTRTDMNGAETPAGYRYVDKKSGKVVMFKSDINTDSFFTYQIVFLKE